ncbi:MAG: M24 family metallopeptidase, partial [Candidatus Nanohaloarchaea archaeon]
EDRIERIKEELVEREKDALIVTGGAYVQYLSGFHARSDPQTLQTYPMVVVPVEGEAVLLVSRLDRDAAEGETEIPLEVPENGFVNSALDHVKGEEVIVPESMTVSIHDRIAEEVQVKADVEFLQDMRSVKDRREAKTIEEAYQITEDVVGKVKGEMGGEREKDIAAEIEYRMRLQGAETTSFPSLVESGVRTASPHRPPTDTVVEEGPVLLDVGAQVLGYCADFSRTFHLGQPSSEFEEVYRTVLKAQRAAIERIGPGTPVVEVDEAARSVIEESGYGEDFPHSTGHGVGLTVHEQPNLSPRADEEDELESGMIITVEPGIYLEGKFGVRVEDAFLVTDSGMERLTELPRDLESQVIEV